MKFIGTQNFNKNIPYSLVVHTGPSFERESITCNLELDVRPPMDWEAGDIVVGLTSEATCTVVSKTDDFHYVVNGRTGVFALGETIGVVGDLSKQAAQGASYPQLDEQIGQVFYDTSYNSFFVYRSTGWYEVTQDAYPIPSGIIIMWDGDIPDGWELCDGSNGTPNLTGRFARGIPNGTTEPYGGLLESDTHFHNLSTTHTHTVPSTYQSNSVSANTGYGGPSSGAASTSHGHTFPGFTLQTSAGGAVSTSSIPIYYALKFIIKKGYVPVLTGITISAPADIYTGQYFNLTVTAVDQYGFRYYTGGTVNITHDGAGTLKNGPVNPLTTLTFINGRAITTVANYTYGSPETFHITATFGALTPVQATLNLSTLSFEIQTVRTTGGLFDKIYKLNAHDDWTFAITARVKDGAGDTYTSYNGSTTLAITGSGLTESSITFVDGVAYLAGISWTGTAGAKTITIGPETGIVAGTKNVTAYETYYTISNSSQFGGRKVEETVASVPGATFADKLEAVKEIWNMSSGYIGSLEVGGWYTRADDLMVPTPYFTGQATACLVDSNSVMPDGPIMGKMFCTVNSDINSYSGYSGYSGYYGHSGYSGWSGYSAFSGYVNLWNNTEEPEFDVPGDYLGRTTVDSGTGTSGYTAVVSVLGGSKVYLISRIEGNENPNLTWQQTNYGQPSVEFNSWITGASIFLLSTPD